MNWVKTATDFDEVVGFESFGDNQYIAHAGEWVNRHLQIALARSMNLSADGSPKREVVA